MTRPRDMLKAALALTELGLPVVPLAPKGKAPLAALAPHGVAHATCDPEVLLYWWRRAPDANIAIACHRLFAVDVDPRNGGDSKLAALLEEHGPFPTTPTQTTGGGGTHYLFRLPALPLLGKLVHGVDLIHGPRRYIVAAPSVLKGGRAYEWLTPPSTPLAEVPGWLRGLALREEARPARAGTLPTVTSAAYYKCGDYKKRRTCSNSLGVKEEVARARIFSALQEKFSTPNALDYLRKRIAEFLGESNRDATRELVERRASLARTEQRIAALIRFVADGDSSEYVVTALRDLHAQARTEKAAIAALEARGAAPIALPTPAEVASRALGLKRLFEGNPIQVREALRRYFVDGRIIVTPTAEGYYVAEGQFLPLVALTDPALETTKPPVRGPRLENFGSCAGRI